ncbi:DNA polymerase Y family protein [Ottowia sp.]|uniref:DNA polymerase Y family protein n=1 Tax=Ottowia sp. TaxID=1898956 RepID=UPI002D092B64|nr:DNA polymerase Y family protein [Ottowia sp.]HRN75186.1 DNA polymerase Y family protein [Ottowia sp.]
MHWLALQWPQPDDALAADLPTPEALAWWALGFTPRVAWVEEALLLEVSDCERLWGGRRALLQRIWQSNPAPDLLQQAQAATSLAALARLRLQVAGHAPPAAVDGLPLHTLSAARPHLGVLARLGCRSWGQLDALPRTGLARRFGPALGHALDVACGRAPDVHAWVVAPERFVQALELPQRADSAPALLWSTRRLLTSLQYWLAARQQGVLALELAWSFDQRRLNGQALPPRQAIELRTAEPVQRMEHIQRLLAERLARTPLLAPARAIRLRTLETAPWQAATRSFLPEDQPRGDPLHRHVERVGARLGAGALRTPVPQADHRPECRQRWQAAEQALPGRGVGPGRNAEAAPSVPACVPGPLDPAWLLRPPQPLAQQQGRPVHQGRRLRLIAGPRRIESGWWSGAVADDGPEPPVARDYFIAQGAAAELLWVYRERPTSASAAGTGAGDRQADAPRWFLHGLYA